MSRDLEIDKAQNNSVQGRGAWNRLYLLVAVTIGLVLLNLYVWGVFSESRPLPARPDLEAPVDMSFDGNSEALGESVFVPTLKQPIPDGKSAIWCCTLSMAWKELGKAFIGPVEVVGSETISRELANSPIPDIDAAHYFAAGGRVEDGIYEHIRSELSRRFPKAKPLKHLDAVPEHRLVGYAYLEVAVLYDFLFNHDKRPLNFRGSDGKQTSVHAFGLREKDKGEGGGIREQVLQLFRDRDQFAVDLSHNTKPYQITLARMKRKATLEETIAELNKRTAGIEPKHLSRQSVLLVPTMHWRIDHDYPDLVGPITSDPLWRVVFAKQSIQFKMDRKGAYVVSESVVGMDNGHPVDEHPDYFIFDRPFLLVMKKRSTQQPFFAMWVDNAELLQRYSE